MSTRIAPQQLTLQNSADLRIGIVQAQFNSAVTSQQLAQAITCLDQYSVAYDVVQVPGAYEIPYALQQLALSKKYDGLVALGCLIKGGTIHFEVISYSVGNAVLRLVNQFNLPIGFGVLTLQSDNQAAERVVIGYDATHAVLQSLTVKPKTRELSL